MYQVLIFLFGFSLAASAQQPSTFDVLKKSSNNEILKAFKKADKFMDYGHYDSAQLSLNKIYSTITYQKPSLFSYFLTSRQAEIYYYNNLHELGLNEAFKAENIAKVLKDSLLNADASNFIGLFYMNNNKFKPAIKNLFKAINYSRQPPYPKQYLELSMPHHIYGNLAEAYQKFNMPDSAIYYSRKSLAKAKEINYKSGIAAALSNLGSAFLSKNELESSINYFRTSNLYAVQSKRYDLQLNSYGGLAICAMLKNNRNSSLQNIANGFYILKNNPQLNDFYTALFLDDAIKVYKRYNQTLLLAQTLQQKSNVQATVYNRNNLQIQTLLLSGLANQKHIFKLELAEAKGKQDLATTQFYIVLLSFLVVLASFITYRYYVIQKLRLANVRIKISRDLHDEIGATLSGIAMYSYITKEQLKNQEEDRVIQSLNIINDNSTQMVTKLSDIVWAVNPLEDNLHALTQRLKDFTLQIAGAKMIAVDFIIADNLTVVKLTMEQRKNIYLICKEAINNAVKYSQAKTITVKIGLSNKEIQINIHDNGIGFTPDSENRGNGLLNMANRAKEIKAELAVNATIGLGTHIVFALKTT